MWEMPVNFVPPDALEAFPSNREESTPLWQALINGYEEIIVYLLSLPRGEDRPPLNLDMQHGPS
jgi:hypothetical protein